MSGRASCKSLWKRPPQAERVVELDLAGTVTGVRLVLAADVGIGGSGMTALSELNASIFQRMILDSLHAWLKMRSL